ncbi:MAG: fibronectin type III domain-containing protein [Gemmatimonadetes bacterium]|nr:fibronectin type III domain-containing protein [Gemmatimonadota bacterium]
MPTFPQKEIEIIALAEMANDGLTKMAQDFPTPPVPVADMQARIAEYKTALQATTETDMMSQQQHAAKDQALTLIKDGLKANLGYAEIAARTERGKLAGLGWGPRRDKSPLQEPGEVRNIAVGKQGDTWLILSWEAPVDGGLPAAYHIQRQQNAGPWEEAGTSAATERVMSNQPRGVQLSYRVIAVNKAGEGAPSGVVSAVL